MTDEQIQQQYNQTMQDETTLDYSKWSNRQRQLKLSDDHDLWEQERDRVLSRQRIDNLTAKSRHLASLEAKRANERAAAAADIDRQLEPQKQTLMRDWLANHPGKTAADFEKNAWTLLRQNLVEQRENEIMQATIESQKATGRYSL